MKKTLLHVAILILFSPFILFMLGWILIAPGSFEQLMGVGYHPRKE